MTLIANLPEYDFIDTDAAVTLANIIAVYEGIADLTLASGDPVRLFLQSLAQIITQQRVLINYSAQQNLLAYAIGDLLDHIGIRTGVLRLEAGQALVTIKYSIDAILGFDVVIPAGNRTTPDTELMFATLAEAKILVGNTEVDVAAQCQPAGEIGNDFVAGQINKIVDPIANVTAVANTTTSSGGSDAEKDDPYRERIRLSHETFSVAGPRGAYRFYALSAHPDIVDVSVITDPPGTVNVYPLMEGGLLPSSEILALVEDALSPEDRIPDTDTVVVTAPTQVPYDIDVTYYIASSQSALVSQIQAAVLVAIEAYKTWQVSKLGRDINPSELISRMIVAGAKRVEVTDPAYQALDTDEVAELDTESVVYGGLEDE